MIEIRFIWILLWLQVVGYDSLNPLEARKFRAI
jgi:hypothetical protein